MKPLRAVFSARYETHLRPLVEAGRGVVREAFAHVAAMKAERPAPPPAPVSTGEEDFVVPPRAVELVASALANAPVVRMPRTGHSMFLERPGDFNRVARSFLGAHTR